jgi:PAS domain S-box-containing protein
MDPSPAEGARRQGAEESGVSRNHLRDLVALLALPALWKEKDQQRIAGDLVDLLVSLLRLDYAFVRMTEEAGETLEHAWPESSEVTRNVADLLRAAGPRADPASLHASEAPAPGGGTLRLVRVEQRFPGEECVVVVGARRSSFPTAAEGFLLQVAADQAAIAVHGARLLSREQAARADAEARAAQMALAAEVGAAVAGAAELDGMLQRCAQAMARDLEAPCAGIWLAEGQVLVLRARGGQCGFSPRHERVPIGAHRVGLIAQERRPHLINQLQYDPLGTDAGWAGRNRLTAFAGYPLVVEDRLIGVLGVYAARPLREQALDLMGGVADMIATGVERKRVEEERSRLAALERQARAEADAERARLRSLILKAPVPIAVTKGPDHVCEIANEPLCEMTGLRDLVGKSMREGSPLLQGTEPLDEAFRTGVQVVVDEYPLRVERNGAVEDAVFKFVIDPYRDSTGAVEGLVVVGVEVTSEVAARRTIQARAEGLAVQQEWLESLLDILPVGVVLIESGTARILLSNKAADRTAAGVFRNARSSVGYDERSYSTDALGRRLLRDEMPGVRAARGEKLRGLEVDWWTPEGTRSLLINSDVLEAAHGHQATVVTAFEDVTELKSTQVALSLALEDSYRFVSVVEESSEFMAIATLEGQVVFVNSAGQKLVGITDPATTPGMTMFDYILPEDHGLARETVAAAIAEGQRTCEMRFRHARTGEPIPVSANLFVLRDRRTDQPVAIATVSHDLTEQKRILELRERVLGIVSHDLRNPLNSIMMGASVLRRQMRASKEAVRIASRIVASAERMDAIIGDLLDLTKVRFGGGIELKLADTDAHELSAHVVDELRTVHPSRKIRLRTLGDATGRWDPFRLEQVISNLASNALQYGREGAPVTIESHGGEEGWTLSVHNLGEPIPRDLLPHLFDPFRRGGEGGTGKAQRNLGLGLFIVRAVVEAHGGTIDVVSARRKGTRFIARLPRRTGA